MGITGKGRRQTQSHNQVEVAEGKDGNELMTKTREQSEQAGMRPNKGHAAILVALLVGTLVVIGLVALGIRSVGTVRQVDSVSGGTDMGTESVRRHGTDETDRTETISLIVMTHDGVPEDEARAVLSEYGTVDGQMSDAGIWLVTPTDGTRGAEQLERLGKRMCDEHPAVIESAEPDLPVRLDNDAAGKASE